MTNQEEFGCQAAASLPLIRIVNQESRAEDSPWREIRKILTRGLCGNAGDNMLVIAGVFGGKPFHHLSPEIQGQVCRNLPGIRKSDSGPLLKRNNKKSARVWLSGKLPDF